MGRKKKPEKDDKEQSAKFLKTAKEIQTEDAKEKFEEACGKVLKKQKDTS